MNMKKISKIVSTKFAHSSAYYTVERNGQDQPCYSDEVVATVTLHLPAVGDDGTPASRELRAELRFEDRCFLFGERLSRGWGYPNPLDPSVRVREKKILGTKWNQVFSEASEVAVSEINKLENALALRAAALSEAED